MRSEICKDGRKDGKIRVERSDDGRECLDDSSTGILRPFKYSITHPQIHDVGEPFDTITCFCICDRCDLQAVNEQNFGVMCGLTGPGRLKDLGTSPSFRKPSKMVYGQRLGVLGTGGSRGIWKRVPQGHNGIAVEADGGENIFSTSSPRFGNDGTRMHSVGPRRSQ